MRHLWVLLLLLFGLVLYAPLVAQGQRFETLFTDNTGTRPTAKLVKGRDGAFYGTTSEGGVSGYGTVFKVSPEGELTTLVSFNGINGRNPRGSLVEGSDGAFYGTTYSGGANGYGTVFKVSPTGELTTLLSFDKAKGASPYAGLVKGSDGAFYGTTYSGGPSNNGTVFKVTVTGELTTLATFNGYNGRNPYAALVEGSDGSFYGTTFYGGANGLGTVFKVTAVGELTTLATFNGDNGRYPYAELVKGRGGVFFGTTSSGGANGKGTVFMITPAGELTTLVSFGTTDGGVPYGGLTQGSGGAFYGTTLRGGANGLGTVFKVTSKGELTTLVSFAGSNGACPYAGLVQGSDGAFYGTTTQDRADGATTVFGDGTVFKVTPEGVLTTLASFNKPYGASPDGGLVRGRDGAFYGTTFKGGAMGVGTVFKMTSAGEVTTLASFNGTNGAKPSAGLVQGNDGNFYGTTSDGGVVSVGKPRSYGTVFKVTPEGELTTLASFNGQNGVSPKAGLVEGSDGAFYGTTAGGDSGATIFKVTPAGELTTLADFYLLSYFVPKGGHPLGLVKGNDGAFYGVAHWGGENGMGTIFKITPARNFTKLLSFDGTNGRNPRALVKGSDGAFYGTTEHGGAHDLGTVFKMTSKGELTTLASFSGINGRNPQAGLVEGSNGAFYGVTRLGGANGFGTIFKVTPAGELTILHSLDGRSAFPKSTPVFDSNGDLYGTADQMTIWRLVLSSAPSVTTNTADAISTTEATLHGSVNPGGTATTVWFEYGTSTAYGSTTAVQNIGADGSNSVLVSQSLTLRPHTTYHFRVVAQNAKGTTYGEDQSFTTLNSIPIATADIVGGAYAENLAIPVLANDSDADGDTLTLVSFTQPAHGELVRAEDHSNVLVYVPQLGFSGVDSFTYTMSDGRSAPVTGTVEITVGSRPNPSSSVALNTRIAVPGAGDEGSGVPAGAIWRSFGEPAINDAGQVAVLATWKSAKGSGSGIFVGEQLVVKAGAPVPGLASATFKSFKDPVLNAAGRVAFLATITGSGVKKDSDTVLVSNAFSGELELVAREGEIAPETGEARFGKFYSVSLQGNSSDGAGLLFTASLLKGSGSPKVKPATDLGAWLRTPALGDLPYKVVREGDPGFAGGETIKSFQLLQALGGSGGQGRGHYKADELSFVVTLSSKRQALVRFSTGTLETVELTGEAVDASLPEMKWKSFGLPASDDTGAVSAVRAVLQAGDGGGKKVKTAGIFVSKGGGEGYAPVARVGEEAFGVPGAVFSAFKDPLVSSSNSSVAFLGTINGKGVRAANNTGLWWQTSSGMSLIARTGTQAAEAPEGARWKSFCSVALSDGEQGPIFVASLAKGAGAVNASNDTGIWAVDSNGELRLLVRERDLVGEKTLKSFSTLKAVSGSSGVRRSFNNTGQLVYRAYFTDGSQGVVKVQVP